MKSLMLTKKQKFIAILFFIMLLISEPYIVTCMFGLNVELVWLIPAVIISVFSFMRNKRLPKSFLVCICIQILTWLFFSLWHNDNSYITRIVFIIVTIFMLNGVNNIVGIRKIIEINNNVVCLQAVLGAVAFLLVFVGVLHPIFEYIQRDMRPAYFYGITCSNTIVGNLIRPAGFFDEPGALSAWGIYALVFNKLFCDNKKLEYLLIVSLIFTLSLAYYVQLILYILLFYSKNVKSAIPIALIVCIAMVYVNSDPSSELYRLTLGRLDTFGDKGFEGTSRAAMTELSKQYFENSPWIGIGAQTVENIGVYSSDNPYESLGRDGVIGTIAIYLPMIYVMIKKRNRYVLSAIAVLAAGYLQRPFHMNIMHYTMMYTFCILTLTTSIKKVTNKYGTSKNFSSNGCF